VKKKKPSGRNREEKRNEEIARLRKRGPVAYPKKKRGERGSKLKKGRGQGGIGAIVKGRGACARRTQKRRAGCRLSIEGTAEKGEVLGCIGNGREKGEGSIQDPEKKVWSGKGERGG